MSNREESPVVSLDERTRGSYIPIVSAGFAAVLVIGLLTMILLTPQKSSTASAGAANGQVEAVRVGALAPNFTLTSIKGGQVQLSSYRGVKPVWINFWATWCTYCRIEMPEMEKLHQQYKDRVEILGVDFSEPLANVQQYVEQGGYSWSFFLDMDARISHQYHIAYLPTHVFIDRTGVIKDIVVGGVQQDKIASKLDSLWVP